MEGVVIDSIPVPLCIGPTSRYIWAELTGLSGFSTITTATGEHEVGMDGYLRDMEWVGGIKWEVDIFIFYWISV